VKKAVDVRVSREGRTVKVLLEDGNEERIELEDFEKAFKSYNRYALVKEYLFHVWYYLTSVYDVPEDKVRAALGELREKLVGE